MIITISYFYTRSGAAAGKQQAGKLKFKGMFFMGVEINVVVLTSLTGFLLN